ncbi:golgin subfamily B member 1-like [Senna tora]|uniref:Golgin subfamily B member 1-like n=1 Tax=Senna tora TaxID=362788 RepID=A0A834SWP2_9FABA|nr:golgin subfamily B member 1-like [Senna tora]
MRCLDVELELRTRRLEKEINEIQSGLEKEFDRRSSDWSVKLEKCQLEEQRLRERDGKESVAGDGKESVAATYKLDKELFARCLQNQGLTMLNESSYFCSELIEFIKGKGDLLHQDFLQEKFGLNGQFIVESDSNIQSIESGIEGLSRSLHDKSSLLTSKFLSQFIDADNLAKVNDQSSEDIIRTELKAECLVTSLLREKLYSKERQVLKSKMFKKDESVNPFKVICKNLKELTIMREYRPKCQRREISCGRK